MKPRGERHQCPPDLEQKRPELKASHSRASCRPSRRHFFSISSLPAQPRLTSDAALLLLPLGIILYNVRTGKLVILELEEKGGKSIVGDRVGVDELATGISFAMSIKYIRKAR